MNCLDSENFQLNNSINKLYKLQNYLENFYYDNSQDIYSLFQLFNNIKEILGNFNTDVSFISCLMAKDYLCHRFTFNKFDVSEKSQSASGLDIVVYTDDSKKINETNTFNLADDLIEPWRAFVDCGAFLIIGNELNLSHKQRKELTGVLHKECKINRKTTQVSTGMELMVDSFKNAIVHEDEELLKLPTLVSF